MDFATAADSAPQIIVLSPRQSPSPAPPSPSTAHRASLTRLASLSNYLLARRRQIPERNQPPTDQPDWQSLVVQTNEELEGEVERLIQEERRFAEQEGRAAEVAVGGAGADTEAQRLGVVARVLGLDFSSTGGVPVMGGEEAEQEAEQQALFVESLRAGEDSRARRLRGRQSRMIPALDLEESDEDEEEGDHTLFQRFLSEEMDRQEMLYGDGEERRGGGEEEEDEEDPWSALNDDEAAEETPRDAQGRRLWRNTPISIPRIRDQSSIFSLPTPIIPRRTPHPPSPNSNSTLNLPLSTSTASDTPVRDSLLLRSSRLAPLSPGPSANPYQPLDAPNFSYNPNSNPFRTQPLTANPYRAPYLPPPGRGAGGRTREETTALMGRTLRMKKGVWSVYCGGSSSGREGEEGEGEELPEGFRWASEGEQEDGGAGCGALVCARGLREGQTRVVPSSSSGYQGRLEEVISTDLPPSSSRVGSLGLGVKIKMKRGCVGCEVREVGCVACGNPLAHLLSRACIACTTQHPAPAAILDGLLWHFRAGKVRTRRRKVGREVREVWEEESEEEGEEQGEEQERERGRRIEPKEAREGSWMKWRELPDAQTEFEASLIGEPSEWINADDAEDEEWWIKNGVAKHCPPPSRDCSTYEHSAPSFTALPHSDNNDYHPSILSPLLSPLLSPAFSPPLPAAPPPPPAPRSNPPNGGSTGAGAQLSRRPAIRISPTRRRREEEEGAEQEEGRRIRRRLGEDGRDGAREEETVGYGRAFVGSASASGGQRGELERRREERKREERRVRVRERAGR